MDEVFAFGDFSQDEVQKLYDAESRPVEFTKTEKADTGVVRERSANHNSVDADLRRNSTGASSPEFQFPLAGAMCGVHNNSASENGKQQQIQFLSSSSVATSSFTAAMVAGSSSIATTSPSSLSTTTSVSSTESPPHSCSSQNSLAPKTPSKLNVHAKEFIPSNLSIISSTSAPADSKNSILPRLAMPTSAVPTSPPPAAKPHSSPVTKPSAEPEATCDWPTEEELHTPTLPGHDHALPVQADPPSNPRTGSTLPSLVETDTPLATVCEVTKSNSVVGNEVESRGSEYCSLLGEEAGRNGSCAREPPSHQEDRVCSAGGKSDIRDEAGNGSASGSEGGAVEGCCALSPKSLSPRRNDPPCPTTPPSEVEIARTTTADSSVRHPLPSPGIVCSASSCATSSNSQSLTLSQSSSASSSSSSFSPSCPQGPKLTKSTRSWASVVGTSTSSKTVCSSSHPVSVNEVRRTSLPASLADPGRRHDKQSPVGNVARDGCSPPDDGALLRLKALGDQLRCLSLRHEPVSIIPRGLQNTGNLCYIHAPLQALLSCPELFHALKSLSLPKHAGIATSATAATDSMIQLVKKYEPYPIEGTVPSSHLLASSHNEDSHPNSGRKRTGTSLVCGQAFKPDFIYDMLSRIESSLSTQGRQEDAEEFLGCVLDRLHEEMVSARNAAGNSGCLAVPDPQGEETEGVAEAGDEEEWEEVGPRNKSTITRRTAYSESPVSAIFGGKLQSSVHRLGKKESATVQPFFSLQLDIQSEEVWSVKDAMEALASKEPINLPGMEEIRAFRRITLVHLPPMLILHIKRFLYGSSGSQKLTKQISYTTEMEIPKDILAPAIKGKLSPQQRTYQLWAVVYHHGRTPNGGHYTCEVYHPPTESWLRTDDSLIKQIPEDWVHKHSVQRPDKVAYLLFYRRQDTINHRRY